METALASACNRYQVIPDHLKGQIDRTVTFEQIKSSPDRNGDLVIWGVKYFRRNAWKTEQGSKCFSFR
jgi:hypothetical protein